MATYCINFKQILTYTSVYYIHFYKSDGNEDNIGKDDDGDDDGDAVMCLRLSPSRRRVCQIDAPVWWMPWLDGGF